MKLTQIIASATVAAVLGTAGYTAAGALSGGSPTASSVGTPHASANVSTGAATNAVAGTKAGRRRARLVAGTLAVAAQTIGITRPALVAELRSGKTVAAVAGEHSVTAPAVIDAIVKAATDKINAAQKAGTITSDQATKLEARVTTAATNFVNGTGKGTGRGLGKSDLRKKARQAVGAAATAIGITPSTLVQELRAGKTIADVAGEHGVSAQTVIDAITKAATDTINAAQTAGTITADQAAKRTARLATIIPKFVNTWHAPTGPAGTAAATA